MFLNHLSSKHKHDFIKTNINLLNLLCLHRILGPSRHLSEIFVIASSGKFYSGPEISLLIQHDLLLVQIRTRAVWI